MPRKRIQSVHIMKEQKKTARGCFSGLRTTIRTLLSTRQSKPSPTFHVSFPSSAFSTPIAAAVAPSPAADDPAADAAEPVYDSISQSSMESDLDHEPIPAYIRQICARLNQQPAMPLGAAAAQHLQLQPSRRLHPSPEVPEDPLPAAADAAVMSDSAFWTGITIDRSHRPAAPVAGAPVETRLAIKDQSANRSRFPVALDILANNTQITFTFKRPSKTGSSRTVTITADLDDYDTIDIEWNRECAYDLMELTEDVRVKCKFADNKHFITLCNAEIYA